MDLYEEMLTASLIRDEIEVTFSNLELDVNEVLESACYQTLLRIQDILKNDNLSDPECFLQIDAILQLCAELGISYGKRHAYDLDEIAERD